jgi:hypothetical protein
MTPLPLHLLRPTAPALLGGGVVGSVRLLYCSHSPLPLAPDGEDGDGARRTPDECNCVAQGRSSVGRRGMPTCHLVE